MNIPLKNIELHLDEQSLLQGEFLLERNRIQSLNEIEKNLWIGNVLDERLHEVEVKISPSRIVAATCECKRYQDIGICEHLAATFLMLRRQQQEKRQEQQKRKKAKKRPTKLTTGAVLDSISHEELIAFVKQYSKSNRNFALALKTRFAPQVAVEESKEKYLQLLDTTISMSRKADRGISLRGSQKIYKVLLEIQNQIEDAIAQKHYREGFSMIQSIIQKITPILKKIDRNQDEIEEQLLYNFQSLKNIIQLQPAPDLKAEIWAYCIEECNKLRYRNNQLDRRFFLIMHSLADEKMKKEQLVGKLSENLLKYEYEGRNPAPLLLILLQVLESLDQNKKAQALVDRYLTEPNILNYAIRQSVQKKDFHKAKALANTGLNKKLPPSVQVELEETLLLIAEEEGDTETIIKFAIKRLTQSFDIDYSLKLKKITGRNWPKYQAQIVDLLRQEPFSLEREELIASIFVQDTNWSALLQHLTQAKSMELLRQFDELLLPSYKKEVYQLYRQFLSEYLHNHLGRKPSTKIRLMLLHLNKIQADDLVRELVVQFRRNYPERHTLMEELEHF